MACQSAFDIYEHGSDGWLWYCTRYFRLSTRPVEQPSRTLNAEVEYGLLRGGYWHGPSPSPDTQLVIAVCGVVTPEALKAADEMRSELGVASEGSDVCVLQVRSRPQSFCCMRQAARRAKLCHLMDSIQRSDSRAALMKAAEKPCGS